MSLSYKEKLLIRFKEKASEVHNNKYDYSRVVSCGSKEDVEIVCPIHGVFHKRKDVHLKGSGCNKCLYENTPARRTVDDLVKEFSKIHENKYDYSLVDTAKTTEKIKIICNLHGIFEQTVAHHLVSNGCPECCFDEKRLSQEQFIKKSSKVHNNKYDYSKVKLTKGFDQKVVIVCPKHGDFVQKAGEHTRGKGCAKCGYEVGVKARYSEKFTTEAFITKAKEVHKDTYNYSKVEYINSEIRVKIVCAEHGEFEQFPLRHLSGSGCIKCRNDKTSYNFIQKYRNDRELGNKDGCVYVLRVFSNTENFLKLGITSNKAGRFKRYKKQFGDVGYSFEILYEKTLPNYQTAMLENDILKCLRKDGKTYKPSEYFSGRSECAVCESLEYMISRIDAHTKEVYFE